MKFLPFNKVNDPLKLIHTYLDLLYVRQKKKPFYKYKI